VRGTQTDGAIPPPGRCAGPVCRVKPNQGLSASLGTSWLTDADTPRARGCGQPLWPTFATPTAALPSIFTSPLAPSLNDWPSNTTAFYVAHVQSTLCNSVLYDRPTLSLFHQHIAYTVKHRTTWTLLLVVSLLLLRDFGTLFHWTVELLHPLTHLTSVLRHFSLIRHNRTVARASVLYGAI